jgi:hypothetical protein
VTTSNNPTSAYFQALIKSATPSTVESNRQRRQVRFTDPSMPQPVLTVEKLDALPEIPDAGPVIGHQRLAKSLQNLLNGGETSIERLAFEVDPGQVGSHQGLWQQKLRGIPDSILKRISIQDSLVASIVNTRGNHIGSFGRPRRDRHGIGFEIIPLPGIEQELNPEEQKAFDEQIKRASELLRSCGHKKGWSDQEQMTFSQYLTVSTKNAVVLGRVATEIIWVYNVHTGRREFHSFRPIDAGTIYRAVPMNQMAVELRDTAARLLERIKRKKLEHEPDGAVSAEDIAWIQVLEGQPRQSFTAEECVVYNFYPVADVEFRGYPLSPLDTVIAAVTTHINITTHNKLYFQSGRASRGILIIKSDDVDDGMINDIRQQFNAAINSVQNSWRVPVLGVGVEENIEWVSTDASQRDMEFQYLSDMTARIILSAFQMSPEELPGYAHLSRGTNNQALSESNQEYLMIAHRDVGLRPLLLSWQDFLNAQIMPLLAPNLVGKCEIRLLGLDAETAEKESIRLQQDAPLHMTYNQILNKVEKDEVPQELGGDFPFNAQWQAIVDKYLTVGQIKEHFFGLKGAAKDPALAYVRDPFWFQWQQLQMQAQQMKEQEQMQQQALKQQSVPAGDAAPGRNETKQAEASQQAAVAESSQQQSQQASEQASGDLTRGIDQASEMLKSESSLPPSKRKLLARHRAIVDRFQKTWEDDSRMALAEIQRALLADEDIGD